MKPSRRTSAAANLMTPLTAKLTGGSPDSPARVPGTRRISRRALIALTAAMIAFAALAPRASTSLSFQNDLWVDGPINAVAHELGDFDEDGDAAPGAPSISSSSPASPANENSPELLGTAEAGSTVNLYASSDCSGSPAATGSAADFSSPGLAVSVGDDSSTTFTATATNVDGTSSCSAGFTYVEDSTAPGAPPITSSSPASPANDDSPELLGAAEAGSTVNLYASEDCSGSPAATGSAAAFSSTGLTVNVGADSSTPFTATATDAAGNTSACSSAFTYIEDSTPPSTPSIDDSSPPSPGSDTSPELLGTADSDSTVTIYASADCSGSPAATGTASAFNSPGLTVSVASASDTDFTATATDAAGNTSDCSSPFTYTACTANTAVTSTDDDGPGTLREAIVNACAADSITFDIAGPGPHTIVLESELYVDKDLTITGPSDERIAISGGGTTTILAVDFFATVTLDRLNFENGFGDFEGGAIENFGVLTVRNSSITGSTGVIGGAICNEGTATVEFTTISGNTALDAGGGLYNAGTLTLRNSTVSGNTSEFGPGGGRAHRRLRGDVDHQHHDLGQHHGRRGRRRGQRAGGHHVADARHDHRQPLRRPGWRHGQLWRPDRDEQRHRRQHRDGLGPRPFRGLPGHDD